MILCLVKLDKFAHQKKAGLIGNTGSLLHVVGDDDDGCNSLMENSSSSIFSVAIGSSAEQGSSSSKHFRLNGEGAGNAEALLLPARQRAGRLVQLVFHFASTRAACSRLLRTTSSRMLRLVTPLIRGP